jgi:hypothetical protein
MALRELEYMAEVQGSGTSTGLAQRPGPGNAPRLSPQAQARIAAFTVNGLCVFLAGLVVQIGLIRYAHLSHDRSYVLQTLFSVVLNFLPSRFLTWRDRQVPFFRAFIRFNAAQLAITGLGMAFYAGLEKFGMNYIGANVAVTAVLTSVSFLANDSWSMAESTGRRVRPATLPWPLFAILAIQVALSARLFTSNTASLDESTYLYVGGQELNHWIHGIAVEDYQTSLSGAPVVYSPLAAIVNAVGGLIAARLLSLCFMLGTTALLYATAKRIAGGRAAVLGAALFVGLAGTQFLGALATHDAMGLFLLALATYLAVGRSDAYNTLTDVAASSVIAAFALALANADVYSTALWDPVVVGLAICAPVQAGHPWRYGFGRGLRFAVGTALFIAAGLAVGKVKYIQGIKSTVVARSADIEGMGQSPSLVFHEAWKWTGVVVVLAAVGALLALIPERTRRSAAVRGAFILMIALLAVAAILAPVSQARIGTTVSLDKHVIFGAWFGCVAAGYALSWVLRYRALVAVCACALILVLSALDLPIANGYYQWPTENMAFVAGLKKLVRPGDQEYLIEGYANIPAYYVGDAYSFQWQDAGAFPYTDPGTGKPYYGAPAFADAIRHRAFTLIILNFNQASRSELDEDDDIASDIAQYGGYQIAGHLPPSDSSSANFYTVWRVTEGKLCHS